MEKYWLYRGRKITTLDDIPDNECLVGFTYKITGPTGRIYIGKKVLRTSRKTRITKKEKLITPTRKVFKRVTKESNWLDYYGSSELLKEDIKIYGKESFEREILELCYSKKYLSFSELSYQIKYDVLRNDSYNGNILSRYFEKDMINHCTKT